MIQLMCSSAPRSPAIVAREVETTVWSRAPRNDTVSRAATRMRTRAGERVIGGAPVRPGDRRDRMCRSGILTGRTDPMGPDVGPILPDLCRFSTLRMPRPWTGAHPGPRRHPDPSGPAHFRAGSSIGWASRRCPFPASDDHARWRERRGRRRWASSGAAAIISCSRWSKPSRSKTPVSSRTMTCRQSRRGATSTQTPRGRCRCAGIPPTKVSAVHARHQRLGDGHLGRRAARRGSRRGPAASPGSSVAPARGCRTVLFRAISVVASSHAMGTPDLFAAETRSARAVALQSSASRRPMGTDGEKLPSASNPFATQRRASTGTTTRKSTGSRSALAQTAQHQARRLHRQGRARRATSVDRLLGRLARSCAPARREHHRHHARPRERLRHGERLGELISGLGLGGQRLEGLPRRPDAGHPPQPELLHRRAQGRLRPRHGGTGRPFPGRRASP